MESALAVAGRPTAGSSPGAPHRGGGLPASKPGLRADTHDLTCYLPVRAANCQLSPHTSHSSPTCVNTHVVLLSVPPEDTVTSAVARWPSPCTPATRTSSTAPSCPASGACSGAASAQLNRANAAESRSGGVVGGDEIRRGGRDAVRVRVPVGGESHEKHDRDRHDHHGEGGKQGSRGALVSGIAHERDLSRAGQALAKSGISGERRSADRMPVSRPPKGQRSDGDCRTDIRDGRWATDQQVR